MNNRLVVSVTDAEKKGEVLPACPWHKVSCQEVNTGTWTVSSFSSGRGFYCKNNLDECFTGVYFVRSIRAVPFPIRDFCTLKKLLLIVSLYFCCFVRFLCPLFPFTPYLHSLHTEKESLCVCPWVERGGCCCCLLRVHIKGYNRSRAEKNGLRETRCESRSLLF